MAHRCVLMARSEYFAAMFSGGMSEAALVNEVQVPDSYDVMARLLDFMYSGEVAPASDQTLINDLVAADRYGLRRMKAFCENMLSVTAENCMQLLELHETISIPRLHDASLQFVAQHTGELVTKTAFREYMKRNPGAMERVLEQVHRNNQAKPQSIMPDELNQDEFETKQQFPFLPMLAFLIFGFFYSNLSR